jgi:hypothetical protein
LLTLARYGVGDNCAIPVSEADSQHPVAEQW